MATLPGIIIMGEPLLGGMYGSMPSGVLLKQIVVLQYCVWYNLVIFFYEYLAARRTVVARTRSARVIPEFPAAVVENGGGENGDRTAGADADHAQDVEMADVAPNVGDGEAAAAV